MGNRGVGLTVVAALAVGLALPCAAPAQDTPMNKDGMIRIGGVLCKDPKVLAQLMRLGERVSDERYRRTLRQQVKAQKCDVTNKNIGLTIQGYLRAYRDTLRIIQVELDGNPDFGPLYMVETHLKSKTFDVDFPSAEQIQQRLRDQGKPVPDKDKIRRALEAKREQLD